MPVINESVIIESILDAASAPPSSSTRIPKVPRKVRESDDYGLYYVPKVVSIGPYHFGNPELQFVEKLKPLYAMELLSDSFSDSQEALRSLYRKLAEGEMVQELRNFYEEDSTTMFDDEVFTKMMLLDSCFILYYILCIFGRHPDDGGELTSHQIVFVHQDLFLLENQIPFKALNEVMKSIPFGGIDIQIRMIEHFIYDNGAFGKLKRRLPELQLGDFSVNHTHHLLHLLHIGLTIRHEVPRINDPNPYRFTFHNVKELVDVGIYFKPSDKTSLAHSKFTKISWWWFTANVELPPITVDDSTKPMLLNLIAFETCLCSSVDSWVTSYVCLMDSLIDDAEDVKYLTKAGVIENCMGRDQDVATMFNEIGTDLVPSPFAYLEAKNGIQRHYDFWKYSLVSQIKHLYLNNPGLFFSYFGFVSLFLSGVQTYFTIWSPKGT